MDTVSDVLVDILIDHEKNRNVRKGLVMAKNIFSSSGRLSMRHLEKMADEEKIQAAIDIAGI